jgi:hypothetical protein
MAAGGHRADDERPNGHPDPCRHDDLDSCSRHRAASAVLYFSRGDADQPAAPAVGRVYRRSRRRVAGASPAALGADLRSSRLPASLPSRCSCGRPARERRAAAGRGNGQGPDSWNGGVRNGPGGRFRQRPCRPRACTLLSTAGVWRCWHPGLGLVTFFESDRFSPRGGFALVVLGCSRVDARRPAHALRRRAPTRARPGEGPGQLMRQRPVTRRFALRGFALCSAKLPTAVVRAIPSVPRGCRRVTTRPSWFERPATGSSPAMTARRPVPRAAVRWRRSCRGVAHDLDRRLLGATPGSRARRGSAAGCVIRGSRSGRTTPG